MHHPHSQLVLALLALAIALSSVHAQDMTFVCDSTNDAVYRMVDFDLDATIDPSLEVFPFYDDSSVGPDLSVPSHLHRYADGILLADSGTLDSILLLRDLNGDGDANDEGEVSSFYDDSSPGPDLSTPNGIAVAASGAVFVSDDGSGVKSIFRLFDVNGDGDALDEGEFSIYYDSSALAAGPSADPESIAISDDDQVFVADTAVGHVYRLIDLNEDGDALDDGESSLFYDGATIALGDIDSIQIDDEGVVYTIDEDNGTIVRLADVDGSGSIDGSEASVFLSGSVITDPNDARLIAPATFLIADGAEDALFFVEDADGSGDASGLDEVRPYFHDSGALLSTPSGVAFIESPELPPAPLITALSTGSGSIAGGSEVEVVGTGLGDVSAIYFGEAVADSFTISSDRRIQATTPAVSSSGYVDVTVESPAGVGMLASGFRYLTPFLRGDANSDGTVVIADAVMILGTLIGTSTPVCPSALDVNDDASIEISDAVYLLSYLFQFGPEPPLPFPTETIDPSPDVLTCE